MDGKDADRMVLAKPVASRPRAHFKSFTELLAGAINASPASTFSETTVAIRPKIVRFKPSVNRAPVGVSQGEISGAAVCCSSGRVPEPDRESTVVYKPLAKLVSRTTASLLANLGKRIAAAAAATAASTPPSSSPSSNIYYRRNANYPPASLSLPPRLHGLSLDAFPRQPQTLQAMKRSFFGEGRASSPSPLASSNIPNKYSQKLLLNMLDNHCIHCNEQVVEGEEEDEPLSTSKGYP